MKVYCRFYRANRKSAWIIIIVLLCNSNAFSLQVYTLTCATMAYFTIVNNKRHRRYSWISNWSPYTVRELTQFACSLLFWPQILHKSEGVNKLETGCGKICRSSLLELRRRNLRDGHSIFSVENKCFRRRRGK